ncbi:MAG TPA: hypothetical protein PKH79_09275 [Prolixibacteraceae bacterium]|nr:hypothetical protein [Prolixibacteraceae bacterium]HPS13111.1 hypothetical protein [Prolixibacteraceae bacterium]
MKQIVFLAVAVLLGVINCHAQVNEGITAKGKETPKTNIKVNKEYDDQGNLIRYDSTYSYSYSNIEADSLSNDSIFSAFRNQFNHRFNFSEDPFFKDFFFQDSVMNQDFFDNDFFFKHFKENMDQMDNLFQQMDSVKNNFFRKEYDKGVKPQFQSL